MKPFEGTQVAITPAAGAPPPGWAADRAHLYLVDPHGNVMMRWPATADRKRMLKDLERLLRASQIGHNHGLANTAPC
jgi:sugar lactone lactonase YvrE